MNLRYNDTAITALLKGANARLKKPEYDLVVKILNGDPNDLSATEMGQLSRILGCLPVDFLEVSMMDGPEGEDGYETPTEI